MDGYIKDGKGEGFTTFRVHAEGLEFYIESQGLKITLPAEDVCRVVMEWRGSGKIGNGIERTSEGEKTAICEDFSVH